MKTLIYIFFGFIILLSCKKDKLKGDYAVLEGNWIWVYSVKHTYNYDFNTSTYDTVYSTEYNDSYEVEFLKKGKIYFKKNGEAEIKRRIVFNYFNECDKEGCAIKTNTYKFGAKLNNKEKYPYNGVVNPDSLTGSNINLPSELNSYDSYPLKVVYHNYYLRN